MPPPDFCKLVESLSRLGTFRTRFDELDSLDEMFTLEPRRPPVPSVCEVLLAGAEPGSMPP